MKHKWNAKELKYQYFDSGKTLQEIADNFGVSRERVRQVMADLGLPRRQRHEQHLEYKSHFKNLSDYLARGKQNQATLIRLIPKIKCSECQSTKNLHIHHLKYPAKTEDDIQILCSSCHQIKHKNGMSYIKQIDLFHAYKTGIRKSALIKQYKITWATLDRIIKKFEMAK